MKRVRGLGLKHFRVKNTIVVDTAQGCQIYHVNSDNTLVPVIKSLGAEKIGDYIAIKGKLNLYGILNGSNSQFVTDFLFETVYLGINDIFVVNDCGVLKLLNNNKLIASYKGVCQYNEKRILSYYEYLFMPISDSTCVIYDTINKQGIEKKVLEIIVCKSSVIFTTANHIYLMRTNGIARVNIYSFRKNEVFYSSYIVNNIKYVKLIAYKNSLRKTINKGTLYEYKNKTDIFDSEIISFIK